MSVDDRDRWVMMSRIRNESRWIARNLERTFRVCRTVVLWDDGSDDGTEEVCHAAIQGLVSTYKVSEMPASAYAAGEDVHAWGWLGRARTSVGDVELRYLRSPYRPARAREIQNVSEIRDKQALWEYVKAQVPFEHVLCLDGDEMLSNAAVQNFSEATRFLDSGLADMLTVPFIYLWDQEDRRRVDGIYGDLPDGLPRFRVPRMFTVRRVPELRLFAMRFAWEGQGPAARAGFHCGSIPQADFRTLTEKREYESGPVGGTFPYTIVHFGYLHEEDRQKKWVFYNSVDPGNEFEGCYEHIRGKPDQHAPGPVQLVPYTDV